MKILCLDFDGVLHAYTSGWKGADVIPDPPVPGAIEFLRETVKHFDVSIFSSRSNQPGGISAMLAWLAFHTRAEGGDLTWLDAISFPLVKPAAFVTIDDRAITFDGTWPSIETLLAFKPWNKRHPQLNLPKINIKLKYQNDSITATQNINVIRVELEDDGSFTAVSDFWPASK